jgi:nicotinate-nucleotide adenylyltransferase
MTSTAHEDAGRLETATEQVEAYIREHLSEPRLRHVEGVARYAVWLAERFGEDPTRARLAALAHDMAREWPEDEMREWALSDGLGESGLEREKPKILHGRAAARMLHMHYGVSDPEILAAIRSHTLGERRMGRLEKILYCADYLEPGRPYIENEFREEVESLDLDAMVCACVEHNTRRGHAPAEESLSMYRELCGKEYPD